MAMLFKRIYESKYFWPGLVFILAFLIRFFYLLENSQTIFFNYPIVDEAMFEMWGKSIAQGQLLWKEVHNHAPLYSYLLAVFFYLKSSLFTIKLFQIFIGSLNVVLLYFLGRKVFNQKIAIIAAFIYLLYWPFVYFDGRLLTPFLSIFLNLSGLNILIDATNKQSRKLFLGAGLLFGLSVITRPDAIFFVGFAFLYLFFFSKYKKQALLFLIAVVICIAPVTIQNYRATGQFILIQRNVGFNFFLGNNLQATGYPYLRAGAEYDKLFFAPKTRVESVRNQYYFNKVFNFVAKNPIDFIRVLGRKTMLTLGGVELRSSQEIEPLRDQSRVLSFLPISFAFISSLGLAAVFLAKRKVNILLFLYFFSYFFSQIIFLTSSRYRLPMIPVLILFSAYTILMIIGKKNIKVSIFSFLLLILFSVNLFGIKTSYANSYYELAIACRRAKIPNKALYYFDKSLAVDPKAYDIYALKGDIYFRLGRFEKSKEQFQIALHYNPQYRKAAKAISILDQMRRK